MHAINNSTIEKNNGYVILHRPGWKLYYAVTTQEIRCAILATTIENNSFFVWKTIAFVAQCTKSAEQPVHRVWLFSTRSQVCENPFLLFCSIFSLLFYWKTRVCKCPTLQAGYTGEILLRAAILYKLVWQADQIPNKTCLEQPSFHPPQKNHQHLLHNPFFLLDFSLLCRP